jgi:hypothetical protein
VGLHWNVDGDERPWYGSPQDDIVEWHLYGKETYDVHALAAEVTRKVRETWGYGKPVLLGEFGYGGDKDFDHTHVGLWSMTFSGGGVLAHSAPAFTEDSDVMMTPERARHFQVLRQFLDAVDPPGSRPPLEPQADPSVDVPGARAWLLGRPGTYALWVMGPKQGYGKPVEGARVVLPGVAPGRYRVRWYDDVTGALLRTEEAEARAGALALPVPAFTRHVAATVDSRTP